MSSEWKNKVNKIDCFIMKDKNVSYENRSANSLFSVFNITLKPNLIAIIFFTQDLIFRQSCRQVYSRNLSR